MIRRIATKQYFFWVAPGGSGGSWYKAGRSMVMIIGVIFGLELIFSNYVLSFTFMKGLNDSPLWFILAKEVFIDCKNVHYLLCQNKNQLRSKSLTRFHRVLFGAKIPFFSHPVFLARNKLAVKATHPPLGRSNLTLWSIGDSPNIAHWCWHSGLTTKLLLMPISTVLLRETVPRNTNIYTL